VSASKAMSYSPVRWIEPGRRRTMATVLVCPCSGGEARGWWSVASPVPIHRTGYVVGPAGDFGRWQIRIDPPRQHLSKNWAQAEPQLTLPWRGRVDRRRPAAAAVGVG
jgi:hypothetical protein